MEGSPVNEHQSIGVVERAVQTDGGMIRTHTLAIEKSCGKELKADHAVVPGLTMHTAVVATLCNWTTRGAPETQQPRV